MPELLSAAIILNKISQAFALTPLTYNESTNKYRVSVPQIIYNLAILTTYSISLVVAVKNTDSIHDISFWLDLLTGHLAQITAIISATIHRRTLINEFYVFNDVDEILKRLNRKLEHAKLTKFILLGFVYIVGTFLVSFVSDYFIFVGEKTHLQLSFSYLSIFSFGVIHLKMCTALYMILSRFRLTNEYLHSLKHARFESTVHVHHGNHSKFQGVNMGDAIYTVQILHQKLCKQCEKVNKIYGFQFFVLATSTFMICVTQLFHTRQLLLKFTAKILLDLYFTVQWVFLNAFQLFIVAYFGDNIKQQISETSRIMSTMQDMVYDDETSSGIQTFLMKEIHQKTIISACGLFNIDNSLIQMVIGLVASYLLVMVQIDIQNEKNML